MRGLVVRERWREGKEAEEERGKGREEAGWGRDGEEEGEAGGAGAKSGGAKSLLLHRVGDIFRDIHICSLYLPRNPSCGFTVIWKNVGLLTSELLEWPIHASIHVCPRDLQGHWHWQWGWLHLCFSLSSRLTRVAKPPRFREGLSSVLGCLLHRTGQEGGDPRDLGSPKSQYPMSSAPAAPCSSFTSSRHNSVPDKGFQVYLGLMSWSLTS